MLSKANVHFIDERDGIYPENSTMNRIERLENEIDLECSMAPNLGERICSVQHEFGFNTASNILIGEYHRYNQD